MTQPPGRSFQMGVGSRPQTVNCILFVGPTRFERLQRIAGRISTASVVYVYAASNSHRSAALTIVWALLARCGFEADGHAVSDQLPQRMPELPENAAPARVSAFADLVEEDGGVGDVVLQQALQQVVAKGIQFRTHQRRRPRRGRSLMNQPADRAPIAAGDPGDFTDRRAGPLQRLNVERFFHPNQPRYLPAAIDGCDREHRATPRARLSTFKPWIG